MAHTSGVIPTTYDIWDDSPRRGSMGLILYDVGGKCDDQRACRGSNRHYKFKHFFPG